MEDLNYNYVIFGSSGYYLAGYHDIIGHPNVYYVEDFYQGFNGVFSRIIVKLFYSEKVNRVVRTPFSSYVFPHIFTNVFKENKPLCFIFFGHWYRLINSSYIPYLRKKYPDMKCVLYMQDLVNKSLGIDMESLREKMDVIITYDKGESMRYGIEYYPTPMSCLKIQNDNDIAHSDFYFCGKPKERYYILKDLYNVLKSKGYSCDFIIIGDVKEEDKVDGIRYQNTTFDYFENLRHVTKTKCVIEIMQEGANGYTPRLWEAIVNDKHLLTNNKEVANYEYFDDKKIHILSNCSSIDLSWVNYPIYYEHDVKEKLSPINFLKHVEKLLQRL